MPSVTVLCRRDKADANGRAPLRLRFRHRGHADASLSLQLRAPVGLWDPDRQRVTGRSSEARQINVVLSGAESTAREILLSYRLESRPPIPTAVRDAVAERLELGAWTAPENSDPDALEYYRAWVDEQRVKGRAAAFFRRQAGLRSFLAFLGDRDRLPWPELTTALVRAYERHLLSPTAEGGRALARSTATGRIKELRTLCRRAVADGIVDRDPTAPLKLAEPRTQKRSLSADELAAVAEAGAGDTRPSVRLAVDVFLFQYHAGGMRFGDAATLPVSAIAEKPDGRAVLIYAQAKTEKVQAFILPSAAAEIARRYLDTAGPDAGPSTGLLFQLCLPSELADPIRRRQEIGRANARVNKALKEAAKIADIPGFSTHAARHSWASQKAASGADLRAIQRALGHATLAMTSRYVAGLGVDVLDLDAI